MAFRDIDTSNAGYACFNYSGGKSFYLMSDMAVAALLLLLWMRRRTA